MDIKQLWQEYSHQLRQFLQSRVDDSSEVDDLLQEILIKTYRNLDTIRQPGKVQSWLFRIARNTLIDRYRRSRADIADIDVDRLAAFSDEDEQYEQIRRELAGCVRPFLSQLPDKYREAVEWVDLQGKSQRVLATELGLSHSAVKSRVQRGRRRLKTLFLECCRYRLDGRGNPIEFEVSMEKGCRGCN